MKGKTLQRCLAFFAVVAFLFVSPAFSVSGETLQEIQEEKKNAQKQKEQAQEELDSVKDDIEAISEEAEALNEEIEELDAELVDLILSVNLLEMDISNKETDIENTRREFEKAKEQVANQEEAMRLRIKFMYEKGQESYLELFVESKSMAEAVNRMEYSEKLYSYDRLLLEKYQLAKQEVADKEALLLEELAELEEIKEDLGVQQEELNALIEEKRETADDFSAQLDKARKRAGEYEARIKQETENIRKLNQAEQEKIAEEARKKALEEAKRKAEEAARKKAQEEEAAKKNGELQYLEKESLFTDSGTSKTADSDKSESVSDDDAATSSTQSEKTNTSETTATSTNTTVTATGSGLGTDIANYALQFVGNPYVAGGTSLTNGCDCSGFTQGVYSAFGISIPRSSYAQSEGGTAVSYDQIQAGDIIYYGGHVAIYIGNDKIVHASTASTGIKISSASYRSIVTIRRYY